MATVAGIWRPMDTVSVPHCLVSNAAITVGYLGTYVLSLCFNSLLGLSKGWESSGACRAAQHACCTARAELHAASPDALTARSHSTDDARDGTAGMERGGACAHVTGGAPDQPSHSRSLGVRGIPVSGARIFAAPRDPLTPSSAPHHTRLAGRAGRCRPGCGGSALGAPVGRAARCAVAARVPAGSQQRAGRAGARP